ncbi:Peroxiredoxin [Aquiflexum balticum DSM 16537]|uniref:Peroxiredoxin n=1 Tax=Aquiflexum balticum DSM 16537 TaxID=758820 RepID=A0A1W2H4X4_9BACT|nr:TlpA disulfide reductase family protein [Aquiflexum balticum]SMD43963.1 Peroxiredoxin [Aquiflexum balticum DSM 16537]
MKNLIILGLSSLLICLSCQNNKNLSNEVTVAGTIENHDQTVLKILDVMGRGSWEDVVPVTENRFSINLTLERPAIKTLMYGDMRKDIFLQPGKSLEVSFDALNIENSFRYGGDLKIENAVFDSISQRLGNIDYSYLYTQPLDLTSLYMDSLKNDSKEYLKSLLNKYITSPYFEEYANASIDYNVAYLKIMLGDSQEEQYAGYYDFLNELKIEDHDLLDMPDYRMFLYFYLEMETNKRYKDLDSIQNQTADAKFYETLKTIENLKDEEVRAYSLYNTMLMQLKEFGTVDFDRHFGYFNTHNLDERYAEQMRFAYEEKKRIAPGQPAPEFTLEDVDGNQVSLSEFKGKYVYVDFWLTTCSRSARELPYFLKLYSDYKEDNIVFVSISPDKDKNTWLDFVKEKRNVGTSLWSDKFLDSEVTKNYQVLGTPTYVLIDKEGNIIDPVAAKPSSKEIRETFDLLLKSK